MPTTIPISDNVKLMLDKIKGRDSYNKLIKKLIEDEKELNKKTKKELEEARKGKSIPHHQVKKRFGL